MSPPSRPRAAASSPGASRTKRSYADMDAEDSETSEFMPVKKGKSKTKGMVTMGVAEVVEQGLIPRRSGNAPKNTARAAAAFGPRSRARTSKAAHSDPPNEYSVIAAVCPRAPKSDLTPPPPAAASKRPAPPAQVELQAALAENALLREQLSQADRTGQEGIMRARQDQMLHLDAAEKRYAKLNDKYRRALARHTGCEKELASMKKLSDETAANLRKETAKVKELEPKVAQCAALETQVSTLVVERSMWEQDTEHYQSLLVTAEDELAQLRQIENEDRAQRERAAEKATLPPAYGSLPDADEHSVREAEDSGSLEVATVKRALRRTFTAALTRAQRTHQSFTRTYHAATHGRAPKDRADAALVSAISAALTAAANNISDVLKRSHEVKSLAIALITPGKADNGSKHPSTSPGLIRQENVRHTYIADRLAKLLLDITLRAIAALEMRPLSPALNAREKADLSLAWAAVDTALLKCLRALFNGPSTPTRETVLRTPWEGTSHAEALVAAARRKKLDSERAGLFELQYFSTKISMVQGRLQVWRLHAGVGAPHGHSGEREEWFRECEAWVGEKIEGERMGGAGAREDEDGEESSEEEDEDSDDEADAHPPDVGDLRSEDEQNTEDERETDEREARRLNAGVPAVRRETGDERAARRAARRQRQREAQRAEIDDRDLLDFDEEHDRVGSGLEEDASVQEIAGPPQTGQNSPPRTPNGSRSMTLAEWRRRQTDFSMDDDVMATAVRERDQRWEEERQRVGADAVEHMDAVETEVRHEHDDGGVATWRDDGPPDDADDDMFVMEGGRWVRQPTPYAVPPESIHTAAVAAAIERARVEIESADAQMAQLSDRLNRARTGAAAQRDRLEGLAAAQQAEATALQLGEAVRANLRDIEATGPQSGGARSGNPVGTIPTTSEDLTVARRNAAREEIDRIFDRIPRMDQITTAESREVQQQAECMDDAMSHVSVSSEPSHWSEHSDEEYNIRGADGYEAEIDAEDGVRVLPLSVNGDPAPVPRAQDVVTHSGDTIDEAIRRMAAALDRDRR